MKTFVHLVAIVSGALGVMLFQLADDYLNPEIGYGLNPGIAMALMFVLILVNMKIRDFCHSKK